MAEFPLLPIPIPVPDQRPRGPRRGPGPLLPTRARQGERLQPVFQRLRNVFDGDRDPQLQEKAARVIWCRWRTGDLGEVLLASAGNMKLAARYEALRTYFDERASEW